MKKVLRHIIIFSLMTVFIISVIGVNINHHICSKTEEHIVSLYHKTDCSHESTEHSCCEGNHQNTPSCNEGGESHNETEPQSDMSDEFYSSNCCQNYSQTISFHYDSIIPQLNHKIIIKKIIADNFTGVINPRIENYYKSVEKYYNSKIKKPDRFIRIFKSVINYFTESDDNLPH